MNAKWTFFAKHAHASQSLGGPRHHPAQGRCHIGITERASQRIVAELEQDGYLSHEKVGRRNHYEVIDDAPLRHSIEAHIEIGDVIRI